MSAYMETAEMLKTMKFSCWETSWRCCVSVMKPHTRAENSLQYHHRHSGSPKEVAYFLLPQIFTANYTEHESVDGLRPAEVLRRRQVSEAAVFLLLLIHCGSVGELVWLLLFLFCQAAVFSFFLFIVTSFVSL